MISVIFVMIAVAMIGVFWRAMLRGFVIVAGLTVLVLGGMGAWDALITKPLQAHETDVACTAWKSSHPGGWPSVSAFHDTQQTLTFEQFASPCAALGQRGSW